MLKTTFPYSILIFCIVSSTSTNPYLWSLAATDLIFNIIQFIFHKWCKSQCFKFLIFFKSVQSTTKMYIFYFNRLHKFGIEDSQLCNMCMTDIDSNEHMLLKSPVSVSFWQDVEKWIAQPSDSGYKLSNNIIRLGDLDNSKATLLPITLYYLAKFLVYLVTNMKKYLKPC